PTLDPLGNLTVNEDSGAGTVNLTGISSGAANENDNLSVSAASSNPAIVPNPIVTYSSPNSTATLSFAPAANAYGTVTITVTVNDNQPNNNLATRAFTITVNPVNDPPTLTALANLTINEDASQQTVNLTGIAFGPPNETNGLLTVTVMS